MAKNYYISQQTGRSGGDGTSLKNASSEVLLFCLHHNKLKPGDTVYVGPGNYQRNGYFALGYLNRGKTNGTKEKPIRFIADPKCKYLVNDKPGQVHLRGTAYQTVNLTSVNHIWLEGFRITSRYHNGGTGIMCRGSIGNRIINCQFDHVGDGILVLDAEAHVSKCRFLNLSYRGMFCSNNSDTIVEDCFFQHSIFRPISCFHTGTKMVVRRCIFKNNHKPLYFNPARGGVLENCWFHTSRSDGVQIKTANVAIRNCTFTNNQGSGLRLLASQYNIHNTVSVENCIFSANLGIGLNHVPKYLGRKTKIRLNHSHNIFWQNVAGNYTSNVTKHESEMVVDPRHEFTTSGIGLKTNSLAIDRGKAMSMIRDDLYLNARPAGNGFDIGAVEAKGKVRPKVFFLLQRGGNDSNSGHTPQKAWKTIKYALRNLVAGDTLHVGTGTYHGTIEFKKSGVAGHPITILGDVSGAKTGRAGRVILQSSYSDNLRIDGGHLVFEGIDFRSRARNLNVVAQTPCVFRKCNFNSGGTAITAVGRLTLDRCRVVAARHAIIYTQTATIPNPTLDVYQCRLAARYYGVYARDLNRTRRRDRIRGDLAVVTLDRCDITCRYTTVFHGVKGRVSNSLLKNGYIGLALSAAASGSGAWNNTIVGSRSRSGLHIVGAPSQFTLSNNIIVNHGTGLYGDGAGNQFRQQSNLFFNNGKDFQLRNGFSISTDVITRDPQFADPSKNNYQLQPTSPAIDAGMETDFEVDLLGQKRPVGNGFDIGCYESATIDDDPGSDAPVPSLWGVSATDSMLFKIGNYNKPSQTLTKFGQLKDGQGDPLNYVEAMTVDSAARAYFVFKAQGSGVTSSLVLGRLVMNGIGNATGTKQKSGRATSPLIVQTLGPIPGATNITGLAIDPTDKVLYAVSSDLYLYGLNKMNGELTSKRRLTFPPSSTNGPQVLRVRPQPEDLVFDGEGNLYVVDAKYLLYMVDKKKGHIIKVAKKNDPGTRFEGVAFDHLTGRLIGSNTADRSLYHLKATVGIRKRLGPTGMPQAKAITFIPGEGMTGGKLRVVEWKELNGRKK